MSRVLVVGYDPKALPGTDAEAVIAALDAESARFRERGIDAGVALVTFDAATEEALVASLSERAWDVVVIGGGIRKTEQLVPLFERIVNLVRRHAPQADLAFNSGVGDSVEAAERWLPA
ncbi:hypothetical protein DEJ48_01255 [Streptomyces venezuelae]|uniref:Uncharacterized protein n=1 Tax=Streptomyces venezuelae TaxID=54571 RepID=A0A5P2BUY4_STRVZ|nr:hypothetical protein [Streptomyces venezuelae]QES32229.1 hypothetical protein DEJ48_01255 [Streptomyces venezuelae]